MKECALIKRGHTFGLLAVTVFKRIIARSSKSIKIGKSDLIDIDCIDQSVEIDDTLVSFIDLS